MKGHPFCIRLCSKWVNISYDYLQVLSIWHCFSHCWKDLGDGRSICDWKEIGTVCHNSGIRASDPWTCPLAFAFHNRYQKKSLCFHPGDPASLADCLGYIIQVFPKRSKITAGLIIEI